MDAKEHGFCLICGRGARPLWKKSRELHKMKEPRNNRIFSLFDYIVFIYSFFFYESKLKIYYSVFEIRKIIIIVSKSKDNLIINCLSLSLSVFK